jgi:hypothetical protein
MTHLREHKKTEETFRRDLFHSKETYYTQKRDLREHKKTVVRQQLAALCPTIKQRRVRLFN